MDVLDAFFHTVDEYPGGASSLGPRMGMSGAVLSNKANINNTSNKPLLVDADRAMGLTGDFRILQALAHKHGFLLVKAPEADICESDMSVLETVVSLGVANGAYLQTVNAALADGKIDKREIALVRKAEKILQTTAAEVSQRLEGMSE